MRRDLDLTDKEFINLLKEYISKRGIKVMFKNANLEKDEDNLMQEECMLKNIAKLKELLLYKEIESSEDNTLILKDGTQIEFYLSDYDCCAGAYGDWILSDNFEGCITNVTHKYSEEKEYTLLIIKDKPCLIVQETLKEVLELIEKSELKEKAPIINFIKLTGARNGTDVYININEITMIDVYQKNKRIVYFRDDCVLVTETAEEILAKIEEITK